MYYVYVHRRASDNSVFYIGKGKGCRAWTFSTRSEFWNKTKDKHGVSVEIVLHGLTEDQAFYNEIQFIKWFGRRDKNEGCLVNLTDGGEGASGSIASAKASSLRSSGLGNMKADQNVYRFVNIHTGLVEEMTRWDLQVKYSLNISDLFSSKVRSVNGWRLEESKFSTGKYDENIYTFMHKDGSEFTGTRASFKLHFGFSLKPLFSKTHRLRTCKGWAIKLTD